MSGVYKVAVMVKEKHRTVFFLLKTINGLLEYQEKRAIERVKLWVNEIEFVCFLELSLLCLPLEAERIARMWFSMS